MSPPPSDGSRPTVEVGVIGGSGLYEMPGLAGARRVRVATPFGDPSDEFLVGTLEGRSVAFLARHGQGHRIPPSALNFRANIYAFKLLGAERILAAGAVGSLREEIRPLDVVLPDQYIDRTRGRISTFFDDGIVAHVGFADPVCPELTRALARAAEAAGARVHAGGTYVCMEGPAFSTRAESRLYRSWGADVIGMTALQEAKLAREAEICFATLALVTDYDCWHESEEDVSVEQILDNLRRNAGTAASVVRRVVAGLPPRRSCPCAEALRTALITDRGAIAPDVRERLAAILDPHLRGSS